MTTFLYVRVSTTDQTSEHQLEQAKAAGYQIDEVVTDHGVSGVSTTLRERPQGRRLFDMLRKGDTLVVRWVDRLGRNYLDVTEAIREFMKRGVIVRTVINGMVFDGATTNAIEMAVRDALIGFMAATAQSQAEATAASRLAGIAHAKAKENAGEKYRGRRPSYTRKQFKQIVDLLAQGAGATAIAKETGLTRQIVLRIRADPARSEATLAAWGL